MEMGDGLKTLFLSSALAVASACDAHAQIIPFKQMAHDPYAGLVKDTHNKPHAFVFRSDMTEGDSIEYHEAWRLYHDIVAEQFCANQLNVTNVGNGYSYPPQYVYAAKMDSVLNRAREDGQALILYYNAHGDVDALNRHRIDIQDKETGSAVVQSITVLRNTVIEPAAHEGIKLNLIFHSCSGDALLHDYIDSYYGDLMEGRRTLPPGSSMQTFAQPGEYVFSSAVSQALLSHTHLVDFSDPKRLHHFANKEFYHDIGGISYQYAPGGSTLLFVKEDGKPVILCPRKSVVDRVGSGLTEQEREIIHMRYRDVYHTNRGRPLYTTDSQSQIDKHVTENLDKVDAYLKNAQTYRSMARLQQLECLRWLSLLEEEIEPLVFSAFLQKEYAHNKELEQSLTVRHHPYNSMFFPRSP